MKKLKLLFAALMAVTIALFFVAPVRAQETVNDTAETETQAEEKAFPYDDWVWVGDSRTVEMERQIAIKAIAKWGEGIHFLEQSLPEILEIRNANIVFNLGVNDLQRTDDIDGIANKYLDIYKEFPEEFVQNNNLIFMSVNPADGGYAKFMPWIEDFNAEMRRGLPEGWTFLDTFSWLVDEGFEMSDGIHFTPETTKRIYDKVTSPEGFAELDKTLNKGQLQGLLESAIQKNTENKGDVVSKVYIADNACIFIEEHDKDNSEFQSSYVVADIYLKDIHDLQTYYQEDEKNGLGSVQEVDRMSDHISAVFSWNGDFYIVENNDKEIIRNGDSVRTLEEAGARDFCAIYEDGTMKTFKHQDVQADPSLFDEMRTNAWHVFSFGPCLLNEDGTAIEDFDDVYNPTLIGPNPRTAIGYLGQNHYVALFISGRVNGNKGATLQEMSKYFEKLGCEKAYNLDGGGTSHMWFMGDVLGEPCEPRKFSDILFIGYPDDNKVSNMEDYSSFLWAIDSLKDHNSRFDQFITG